MRDRKGAPHAASPLTARGGGEVAWLAFGIVVVGHATEDTTMKFWHLRQARVPVRDLLLALLEEWRLGNVPPYPQERDLGRGRRCITITWAGIWGIAEDWAMVAIWIRTY